MMKYYIFLLISTLSLYAKTIERTKSNIHAFLPANGEISILVGAETVNDTIDVLNIKESEFDSNSASFDSLGDMNGLDLELGYSFIDDAYLNFKVNYKELQYADATLKNLNLDLYLRYQAYQSESTAIAFDGGIAMNKANDVYSYDLSTINQTVDKIAPDKEISITNDYITYTDGNGVANTVSLANKPYLAIVDTYDESMYMRGIVSYKLNGSLFDAYLGFKYTKIQNGMDSSFSHEDNVDLQKEISKLSMTLKRDEGMTYGGLGYRCTTNFKLIAEINYQFSRMFRDADLKETDINHIIDMNILYAITDKTYFFIGGKIMSNQFNGEINYLYNKYTKTTFDHKYGYANTGFIFKF